MNRSGCKSDIWILPQGTLALVRPLTEKANEWIKKHAQTHSQWFGPALVIEDHYLANLRSGMIKAGLQVTQ